MAANLSHSKELVTLSTQLRNARDIIQPLNSNYLFPLSTQETSGLDFLVNYFTKPTLSNQKKIKIELLIEEIKKAITSMIATITTICERENEILDLHYFNFYKTLKNSTESLLDHLDSIALELDPFPQAKNAFSGIVAPIEHIIKIDVPAMIYIIAQEYIDPEKNFTLKENLPIAEELKAGFAFTFNATLNENSLYRNAYLQQHIVPDAVNGVIQPKPSMNL